MLTIAVFNAMGLEQRLTAVEEHGIYLLSTQCEDHQHIYYRVDDFLVELVQVFEGLFVDEAEAFGEGDERMEELLEHIQPNDLVDLMGFSPPTSN